MIVPTDYSGNAPKDTDALQACSSEASEVAGASNQQQGTYPRGHKEHPSISALS